MKILILPDPVAAFKEDVSLVEEAPLAAAFSLVEEAALIEEAPPLEAASLGGEAF